jgi:hypothetical protein
MLRRSLVSHPGNRNFRGVAMALLGLIDAQEAANAKRQASAPC